VSEHFRLTKICSGSEAVLMTSTAVAWLASDRSIPFT